MNPPPLHDVIAHLAPFVGAWQGTGEGHYPTIDSFTYTEQLTIGHVGKPFLALNQKTKRADGDREPLHAEAGYLRPVGTDKLELILVHPSGITELHHAGTIEADGNELRLTLASTSLWSTPTAKEVTAVERIYTVTDDELRYDISMAAVGQPMTHHLSGLLHRVVT